MNNENIIYGVRPVIEAIRAGKAPDKVLINSDGCSGSFRELLSQLKQKDIPVQRVPVQKLNRLTKGNHQGVVAFINNFFYSKLNDIIPSIYERGMQPMLVALDSITDVRNLGAVARSAECAGAHGLIIPATGSARVNGDAIKTSAGALNKIAVCREKSLSGALRFAKESGLRVIACVEKGDNIYHEADYNLPVVIVLGSEDTGISKSCMDIADEQIRIPMHGTIESLNVSVAAAVVLFEAARQRSENQL